MSLPHWESVLPDYCDSGYEIVPLRPYLTLTDKVEMTGGPPGPAETSASAGKAGIVLMFSIQEAITGKHVAMAWISLGDGATPWKFQQVRVPDGKPLPRIVGVAKGIATLYMQNERPQGTLRSGL